MTTRAMRVVLTMVWAAAACGVGAQSARIAVDAGKPGAKISPLLYGIFFEEINRAGDGGLYAELVQNRSFEDAAAPLGWTLEKAGDAELTLSLDTSKPLNEANPTSLRLDVTRASATAPAGVANRGFRGTGYPKGGDVARWLPGFEKAMASNEECVNGIAVRPGGRYRATLHARCDDKLKGPLTVALVGANGTTLAEATVAGVGAEWKKFECELSPTGEDPEGRLVIRVASPGTLWLDMVSLFPPGATDQHPFRRDLFEMVKAMKPAFVRFPGGCFVEGDQMADATRWKQTIGDTAARPGHYNLWGYRSNDGLGYHEYLQLCEDLGAEPLFVINCGMAHKDHIPMDRMDEYVQDALDAIEYANGPADSKWGALRAKAGHPAPFGLKLMEVGNENGGPAYEERYPLFYDAIRKAYPKMRLIVDYKLCQSRSADIVDEHYYNSPEFFLQQEGRYDKNARPAPEIYVGEYAVTRDCGAGNQKAAVGEAAFMTGMERNGDIVTMCSYAPLFVNPAWRRWNPNAIVFDSARCYGTPSYHVQAMFANHRGDVVLPVEIEAPTVEASAKPGMIGVGTWQTQAEFKDIRVEKDGQVLFQSDFSKGMKGWSTLHGQWEAKDSVLRQTSGEEDVRAAAGRADWKDYTLSLKARKLGGREGFLILFQVRNVKDRIWWNIGGWGNREHGIEGTGVESPRVPGKIETGRWYDIRVETKGPAIRCFLDGKLIHELVRQPLKSLYAVAGREDGSGDVILKVAHAGDTPVDATISLRNADGLAKTGRAWVLASADPEDENSFAAPSKVAPREEEVAVTGPEFRRTFPANSVTVLRIKARQAR